MSFKEPEAQVARWLEELQSYNFTVIHKAGSSHTNADALSRCPCAAKGCRHCENRETLEKELRQENESEKPACRALRVVDAPEWQLRQEQDDDLRPVLSWLEVQQRPEWGDIAGCSLATKGLWSKFNTLQLSEGVLQRAWKEPATGKDRWQVIVPKALREAVLTACHGSVGTGHFGVPKTLRRLCQGFYWGQHRGDVEDFCRRWRFTFDPVQPIKALLTSPMLNFNSKL